MRLLTISLVLLALCGEVFAQSTASMKLEHFDPAMADKFA